jgi:hypothetical protein
MTTRWKNRWLLTEQVVPPVVFAALLVFQLGHLSIERTRSRVPVYAGVYVIQEEDLPYLPRYSEMKSLAVRVGTGQGLRIASGDIDAWLTLDRLQVTVRVNGHSDWESFFLRYGGELRRATLARWNTVRAMHSCTCSDVAQIGFEGWSSTHESWIRPLDLASLIALGVALVMWVIGGPPSGAQ